jgi:F420-non-reducing hydrogenase iron-sulfur subunit
MCTGRLDPALVAHSFQKGLDGLMLVGCYFGDCHYITGNYQAQAKMNMTRRLFKHIGLNEDRLSFNQCSSAEGARFVELTTQFTERIREIGPLGQGGDAIGHPELMEKLESAHAVLDGEKMRWVIGKRTEFMTKGNKYGERFTNHEFSRTLDMIVVEEFELQEIMRNMKGGDQSVKDLAATLNIPAQRVFRYITALRRKGLAELSTVQDRTPLYHLT